MHNTEHMNRGGVGEENRLLFPIRKFLLKRLQLIALTVGIIPLVSGIIASIQGGVYGVLVADAAAYLLVFLCFILLRDRFTLNAVLFVVVLLLIGILLLYTVGMRGASIMWLFTPVALAALLLPVYAIFILFFCTVFALVGIGFLLSFDLLPWNLSLSQWIVIAGSYVAITLFLVLSTRFIIHRLAAGIQRERSLNITLRQTADEKEELIRELHHRVKNNLQLIKSILHLENYGDEHGDHSNTMHIMEHRIGALALSYSHLELGGHALRVQFSDLLETLIDQVHDDAPGDNPFLFSVLPVPVFLTLEIAVPLSLLVSELLTYAIRQGEKENRIKQNVPVVIDQDEKRCTIEFNTSAEEKLPFPDLHPGNESRYHIIQALMEQLSVSFDTNEDENGFSKISFFYT